MVPGDPATLTGGYLYDQRIAQGLRERGWHVFVHALDASFPLPSRAALEDADALLSSLPDAATVVIDGLAFGGMPALAERHATRLRLFALVHHPLADETGLDAESRALLLARERRALAAARGVIVTSRFTARSLTVYGVDPARIAVVEPGVDPAPAAAGGDGRTLALLCVATLTPRKGHDLLLEALARLGDRPWRLECVGDRLRNPVTTAALLARCARLGLADRVDFRGAVDAATLARYYDRSDVFVLASWHEGYGMALTEALARALPIVSTTAGAIPETVPAEAGLLVPPGDVEALTAALARVLDDADERARLAAGARAVRASLPSWGLSSARFEQAIA